MKLPLVSRNNGYNPFVKEDSSMMMDVGLVKLTAGQIYEVNSATQESVFLLLEGQVEFAWDNQTVTAIRHDLFKEKPSVLHVCRGVAVIVTAIRDTELIQQQASNLIAFDNRFYGPADSRVETVWKDHFAGCAVRDVITTIDYSVNPLSKLVIGEVINHPGKWSSFIPHSHPQPEVYFYRFDAPQGFGAAFEEDDVYKSVDYSFSGIEGGKTHPQVAAPGYAMYFCWMIRHFDGNPWTSRNDDPAHLWLIEKDAKIWPNK
ncbi:MAG: 5-deoxy-glucuronate isomerase [Erysipelotrichaceae bacterium]